jgi:2-furoyl-CoA dehydrogenase FAD binding subunit
MKPAAFDYYRPETIEETISLLSEYGDDSLLLSGGLSLGPMLNMRVARPSVIIDINRIKGLGGIAKIENQLKLGALARQADLATSKECHDFVPLLTEAMKHVGHYQTRSRGTVGGSVAHADPSAEIPLCAVTLGADVELMSLSGKRTVPADDFFVGALETVRAPDELVTAINFPVCKNGGSIAFEEISERKGDFAIVAMSAWVGYKDEKVAVRAGFGGVEDRPRYLEIVDFEIRYDRIIEQINDFVDELAPLEDRRATGAFRKQLARHLGKKVFKTALGNSEFETNK